MEHREEAVKAYTAGVVNQLREVADRIEDGNDPLHEIPWGLANLNLSGIARKREEFEYMRGVVQKYRFDAQKEVE